MASLTTSTRLVSVQLVNSVLRRRKTLEEATSSNNLFASLGCRDRAFVWLLVTTCLRRLGQIDALINNAYPRNKTFIHHPPHIEQNAITSWEKLDDFLF